MGKRLFCDPGTRLCVQPSKERTLRKVPKIFGVNEFYNLRILQEGLDRTHVFVLQPALWRDTVTSRFLPISLPFPSSKQAAQGASSIYSQTIDIEDEGKDQRWQEKVIRQKI